MVYPDQLLTEARAQIIWGEPPSNVLAQLRGRGLGEKSARAVLTKLAAERARALRDLTLAKITHGVLLLCAPVAGLIFCAIPALLFRHSDSGLLILLSIPLGILFRITFYLGLWGLWKIGNGLFELLRPSRTLDLSHYEE